MKQPKIELLKTRDFGEVISDTFAFIAQNFKPLLICFFTFSGIFLLGNMAVQTLQQMQMADTMKSISDVSTNGGDVRSVTPFSMYNWTYMAIGAGFILLAYTVINITIFAYIALYREKGNTTPTLEEIWGYIKYYFLRVLGAQLVLGLLICVAFALCLVPGFWLFPIFSLVIPIIIFENTGFGYAFNRAFTLIKDNWWITFGTLLVIGIITYLFVTLVMLPVSAFNVISLFMHRSNGIKFSTGGIIASSILAGLCQVFYIIPNVAISLCYYNLNEIKEGTGIMGRIMGFGQNLPDSNLPTEEY